MGQQVVFNYPMVSLKVPTRLMIPYIYLMGHHGLSFVSKNGRKQLKTGF
jgi:FMN-dependent NADH-azoreductase